MTEDGVDDVGIVEAADASELSVMLTGQPSRGLLRLNQWTKEVRGELMSQVDVLTLMCVSKAQRA